jgi:hypothetical protein
VRMTQVAAVIAARLAYSSTLKMKAVRSAETGVGPPIAAKFSTKLLMPTKYFADTKCRGVHLSLRYASSPDGANGVPVMDTPLPVQHSEQILSNTSQKTSDSPAPPRPALPSQDCFCLPQLAMTRSSVTRTIGSHRRLPGNELPSLL